MEVVRECYVLVGQFGRRVLCWVYLGGEEDAPKPENLGDGLVHDLIHHDGTPSLIHSLQCRLSSLRTCS
jgi:hypothetical protein